MVVMAMMGNRLRMMSKSITAVLLNTILPPWVNWLAPMHECDEID